MEVELATGQPVTADVLSRWVPLAAGAAPDALCLFCLPHAGGGASAFRSWVGRLPGVAVLPVQPPGRETRLREPAYQQMEPLAADLASILPAAAAGRPYAVYGHSLGALVAFETVRSIRDAGAPAPGHLFLSGCVAPQCWYATDSEPIATAPVETVVAMMRELGGTPEWLLSDPGALEMVVPAIRADFAIKESYAYRPQPPLDIPVTVLASTADRRAPQDRQARWREHTTAAFSLNLLAGGHFAVFKQGAVTRRHLADALAAWPR